MVNMTLSIPDDLYREMMAHSELKWSDIARKAFQKKVRELHWTDEVLKNSALTEKDAERIGHSLKRAMAKRFSR